MNPDAETGSVRCRTVLAPGQDANQSRIEQPFDCVTRAALRSPIAETEIAVNAAHSDVIVASLYVILRRSHLALCSEITPLNVSSAGLKSGSFWATISSIASAVIRSAATFAAVSRALVPLISSAVSSTTFWTSTTANAARPATAATISNHSSVVRPLLGRATIMTRTNALNRFKVQLRNSTRTSSHRRASSHHFQHDQSTRRRIRDPASPWVRRSVEQVLGPRSSYQAALIDLCIFERVPIGDP